MLKTPILISLFVLILSGCGGGSTATSSNSNATATSSNSASTSTSSLTTSTVKEPTVVTTIPDVQQCDLTADISVSAINIVNQVRAESRNCGNTYYAAADPVVWNNLLSTAAQSHSDDMAGLNFFSHTSSNGDSVGDRVTNAGYVWRTVGENISAGRDSLQATIDGLVNSPGHCANIMNPNFVEMAVACTENSSSRYGVYWTQVFATQR